jgi:hypothetical protein
MPKLLVFAPCEKVIISQDENNPTLIAILSTIGGEFTAPNPLDIKAVGPMRWSIFTLWQKEAEDETKIFEQRLRLVSPSVRIGIVATQEIKMTVETHRTIAYIGTVPVGENGKWEVQVFIYLKGEPTPPTPLATYPLEICFQINTPKAT